MSRDFVFALALTKVLTESLCARLLLLIPRNHFEVNMDIEDGFVLQVY